ncbi:unnamed protein product [Strongylus vulgaris]|uniref:Uncharacterized protein n=1 Tax=Strongylus vulgaris TaxID=40348 RepID=A0A3P7J9I4_STRVU|nr:unnamed protein product [Strongylus vulgaris]
MDSRDPILRKSAKSLIFRKHGKFQAANPANTLDGLVARRADDTHEPFQKRYLSEQEAIEGPDDEAEAKNT